MYLKKFIRIISGCIFKLTINNLKTLLKWKYRNEVTNFNIMFCEWIISHFMIKNKAKNVFR